MSSRLAVFLDRDGVLNRTIVRDGVPYPPASLAEVEILRGVPETLDQLAARGFLLVVVTNQPDVARGTQSRQEVERINQFISGRLSLTAVYTCFHDTPDNCSCRKPKPGLLIEAARAYNIHLAGSFMIGDRWSDVAAGQAAGCKAILIEQAYSQRQRCKPDYLAADLSEAADIILRLTPAR